MLSNVIPLWLYLQSRPTMNVMHASRQASGALCSTSGRSLIVTRLQQRRSRRRHAIVRADLESSVDHIITAGAVSISVAAGLLAVFADRPVPEALRRSRSASSPPATGMGTDNFRWAVMGVIGCFPLFNWMVRRRGGAKQWQVCCLTHATCSSGPGRCKLACFLWHTTCKQKRCVH